MLPKVDLNPDDEPFVGPRPFEEADKDLFFGRDREASELLSLVIANRAVLLYAQSGAGKTSLLNARLIPHLEKEGLQVLPPARVHGPLPPALEANQVENLYAFNVLLTWAGEPDAVTLVHLAKTPIETFLSGIHRSLDSEGQRKPLVLIFDQLEELFIVASGELSRQQFFAQVQQAIEADPLLRVLFTIREDFLARLDPYAHLLPGKLRRRYRLEGLNKNNALAAVKGPFVRPGRPPIDQKRLEKAAKIIVKDLLRTRVETSPGEFKDVEGEFVEPVALQVVCHALWHRLPEVGDGTISEKDLQAYGDTVDEALTKYYEDCVKKVAGDGKTPEADLRRWFDNKLITPQQTRWSGVLRDASAGTAGGLPDSDVDALEKAHVVRTVMRAGARWCELAHDRFVGPIRKANERWFKSWEAAQTSEVVLLRRYLDKVANYLSGLAAAPELDRIVNVVVKLQLALPDVAKAPLQRLPMLLLPARRQLQGEADVKQWFADREFLQSVIRKSNALLERADQDLSIRSFFSAIEDKPGGKAEDKLATAQVFALQVLAGNVHLSRSLDSSSYPCLEKHEEQWLWLSDVKRTMAFLLWEDSIVEGRQDKHHWTPEQFYYEACERLRARLVDGDAKASAAEFKPIGQYIKERYLDSPRQLGAKAEELVGAKANRIYKLGHGEGWDADGRRALLYCRLFYENVIAAVEDRDRESTLFVLKAFQYSKAPENRFLITNCFEAAIAIYFLDAEIVKGLWQEAKGKERQGSYTVTTAPAPGWPDPWTPPAGLAGRLSFRASDSRLVLLGPLREREKEELLRMLPGHRSAIEQLFDDSRVLPAETTL